MYGFIRKPNFKNSPERLDYNNYWEFRGWSINKKLKNREKIALDLIKDGESVLDVGCGNSLLPIKLSEKNVLVSIADASSEVLKGYRAHGISGEIIDLEKSDISVDGNKNYDYIILFEVLEHLRFPETVIQKLKKRTKRFLITVPNSAAYFYRYNLMFNGRFFTQWIYHPAEHLRYWSHTDFLDWLDAQGLCVKETYATDGMTIKGLFPNLPQIWKNFLAYRVLYVCEVKEESNDLLP